MRPEDTALRLIWAGDYTLEGKRRIMRELTGLPLTEAVSLLLFAPPKPRNELIRELCTLEEKELGEVK